MKVVRQRDSWSCHACVAAMITGQTLEDVIRFIGHDGSEKVDDSEHPEKRKGFTVAEINFYLAYYNYTLGVHGVNIEGFEADFYKKRYIQVEIELNVPAMIIVRSTISENLTHCLYYDGKKSIYDPYKDNEVDLRDYEMLSYWPVVKINSEHPCRHEDNREFIELKNRYKKMKDEYKKLEDSYFKLSERKIDRIGKLENKCLTLLEENGRLGVENIGLKEKLENIEENNKKLEAEIKKLENA